jgi:hypothetical protein
MNCQEPDAGRGICRLCGELKDLTFEHVPPRAAGNAGPVYHPEIREYLRHRTSGGPPPKLITEPQGAGGYTLCRECNNRCARYVLEFLPWLECWRSALAADATAGAIGTSQNIRRSRVMKEIVAMFLSANSPEMGRRNEELRRFVWNAEHQGLPDGIRVFAALTRDETFSRQVGVTGVGHHDGAYSVISEVAYPPMSLVMAFGGTDPGDPRLVDITFLARSGYKEKRTTEMMLQVLRLADIYPATYH